eukprot:g27624.t1
MALRKQEKGNSTARNSVRDSSAELKDGTKYERRNWRNGQLWAWHLYLRNISFVPPSPQAASQATPEDPDELEFEDDGDCQEEAEDEVDELGSRRGSHNRCSTVPGRGY